jgi:hypothetical protein
MLLYIIGVKSCFLVNGSILPFCLKYYIYPLFEYEFPYSLHIGFIINTFIYNTNLLLYLLDILMIMESYLSMYHYLHSINSLFYSHIHPSLIHLLIHLSIPYSILLIKRITIK